VGLYQWVRCPNYLGEIIFWLGNWVAAFGAYTSWLRWGVSLIGLTCIILIMMGSTKRLEQKQKNRYGSLPEFQEYIESVPVLFPFVPVYSLERIRVYLE
jgi:steroid 5-alpha reductase family enzyme